MVVTSPDATRRWAAERRLEHLLAHCDTPGWLGRLREALVDFRDCFAMANDDGVLITEAPRMVFLSRRLERQRHRLWRQAENLLVDGAEGAGMAAERRLRQLVREVRRYRRGVAELLYQVYEVDLGGEH